MFREVNVSALLALGEREILVVLGKCFLKLMPSRVVRWVVRRAGEVRDGSVAVVLRSLCEGRPAAGGSNVVPANAVEKRKGCEDAEYAKEVKSGFPVSPWDNCLDSVWGNRGQDGGTHACRHSNRLALASVALTRFNPPFFLNYFLLEARHGPSDFQLHGRWSQERSSREIVVSR